MSSDKKGYYKLLDLTPGSSISEVETAFKKQVRKYHPEGKLAREYRKLPEQERAKKMKEIEELSKKLNSAREVLTDKEKKQMYDSGMDTNNMGGFNMNTDGFDIFDFFNGGGRQQRQRKVENTRFEIKIEFEQAYSGTDKRFKINRKVRCSPCNGIGGKNSQSCSKCRGKGSIKVKTSMGMFSTVKDMVCDSCRGEGNIVTPPYCTSCKGLGLDTITELIEVSIPKGVQDGQSIKFQGKGDQSKDKSILDGDLEFVISYKSYAIKHYDLIDNILSNKHTSNSNSVKFYRSGNYLIGETFVDIANLVDGKIFQVPHLDGKLYNVNVSNRFENFNDKLVIPGKGFAGGDYVVQLRLLRNKNLTSNNRLEEYRSRVDRLLKSWSGSFKEVIVDTSETERQQQSRRSQQQHGHQGHGINLEDLFGGGGGGFSFSGGFF